MATERCAICLRWLCRECMVLEDRHAQASTAADGDGQVPAAVVVPGAAPSLTGGGAGATGACLAPAVDAGHAGRPADFRSMAGVWGPRAAEVLRARLPLPEVAVSGSPPFTGPRAAAPAEPQPSGRQACWVCGRKAMPPRRATCLPCRRPVTECECPELARGRILHVVSSEQHAATPECAGFHCELCAEGHPLVREAPEHEHTAQEACTMLCPAWRMDSRGTVDWRCNGCGQEVGVLTPAGLCDPCAAARGLAPDSAPEGRAESFWRALAVALGLTLHEAAVLAHGGREAAQRAASAVRSGWRACRTWAAAAGRGALAAVLRQYGWELLSADPARPERYRAARVDGVASCNADTWRTLLRTARANRARPALVLAAIEKRHEEVLAAQAEAEQAHLNADRRRAMLKRLGSRTAFYRQELREEWQRRVRAEEERDAALVEAGEAAERAYNASQREESAEERAQDLGVQLEALGGDLERLSGDVDRLEAQRHAWRTLFFRVLALAAQLHAWKKRAQAEKEHLLDRWLRDKRNRDRLLRAERREARSLRNGCRYALDALEDWDTAWTVAGVSARQELRRALGERLWPTCPWCGVDTGLPEAHAEVCPNKPAPEDLP